MNKRNIVIVVVALVLAGLFLRSLPDNSPKIEENTLDNQEEAEKKLEEVLGKTIPDNAQKLTLTKDSQTAVVARSEENGTVNFTVLADLEKTDQTYRVWVGSGADNLRQLGALTVAKGGYLFESKQAGKLDDYKYISIRLAEENILEGSF